MCLGLVEACQYKTLQTKINRILSTPSVPVTFRVNCRRPFPTLDGVLQKEDTVVLWWAVGYSPSGRNCVYITPLILIHSVSAEGPHPTRTEFIS